MNKISRNLRKLPWLAIHRFNQGIRFRVIGKIISVCVPIQFVSGAVRNVSHMRQRSRILSNLNITNRFFPAFDAADEVVYVLLMIFFVGNLERNGFDLWYCLLLLPG